MALLPEADHPNFLTEIRRVASSQPNPERYFRKILGTKSKSSPQRFAALYGLLLRLRREARFPEFLELTRKYESEFSTEPLYDTFRVTIAKWISYDPITLRQALAPATRALDSFPDQPGVLHSYADLVVSLFEIDEAQDRDLLKIAERSLNKAIDLSNPKNANYFSTRARLMVLKGDFGTARADVATAISLEDSTTTDFVRRMARYEGVLSMITLRQAHEKFVSKHQVLLAELNAFRREQLQMLALMAAVIALIVGGLTVSTSVQGESAVRLLLISSGSTAIVFVGIAALLARAEWGRTALAFGIGVALISLGVWWPT